jgi:hypothetical protein
MTAVIEQNPQPILVSGAHRSGTTWVGKMLAAGSQVAYISEPLNVWHRHGVFRAPTKYWYSYICEDNQDDYLAAFQEMLSFEYHTELELRSIKSAKDFLRMIRDWKVFWNGRRNHQVALVKDPFAIFSSEWFNERLGCRVIIVVRHPAAVTSSLMKLGWNFDMRDMINQPLLLRDWLAPFSGELEKILESPGDLIAESCLLWRMVYQSVNKLRKKLPGLIVIRHEDISLNPVEEFSWLYHYLGLEFTAEIQSAILAASSGKNPSQTSKRSVHSVHIDSQSLVKSWKQRLSVSDIDRIRQLTHDVAPIYYTDEEWA